MARLGGFEPPTAWFVARYSIQLSYSRLKLGGKVARLGGFEPPTAWFVARYSIQLSYSRALVFPVECYLNGSLPSKKEMAEREGFEPSVRLLVRFLSRELVSATHPPLLENGAYTTIIFLFS